MKETFGQTLRRLRGTRSLRTVAQLAHCSKSYVGDLESGQRKPTEDIAAPLDMALNTGGELLAFTTGHRKRSSTFEARLRDALPAKISEWPHP
ncbi:helix-turn-helix domain-containing protein [Streptomyces phytophilus]|uniref:helix-turn-helix domain-containing protein n=1 Tax=Streptomyces phytophilus TaxID=722715 RepID=UPI0015F1225C|nr:helix-turn-helix transcriptional regulator [Streptomyces phytophilus]